MRFSSYLLAAGLSASALAAPAAPHHRRPCKKHTSSIVLASSSAVIATPTAVAATTPAVAPTKATASVKASSASAKATASAKASAASSVAEVSSAEAHASGKTAAQTAAASTSAAAVVAPSSTAVAAASSASTAKAEASSTSAAAAKSTAVASTGITLTKGKLQFLGVSESGAEFGNAKPGTYGTDYIFPETSSIKTLIDNGMNTFRIPFLMERLARSSVTGTFDAAYLANLTSVVNYITEAGKYAVLDPHNYARYNGNIISSTSDFKTFWTNLATKFASNSKVIFDCNNEPHDMGSNTLTAELNQACIDGVRAAGAKSQYIFVEGTAWTGAWSWVSSGNSQYMGGLTDSENKIIYEMHQYLDSDKSGTSATCVSKTIGSERLKEATEWLRTNKKVGIIGEFAGGVNADCEAAVEDMLSYMKTNSDVWAGALWWGAGPWWHNYIYAFEPPSGQAYTAYKDILAKYAPSA